MTELLVSNCESKAARFAVMNWHYSEKMPVGKLITHGVWENQSFIGTIIYGRGASNSLGKPYGLSVVEVCELVRVAMREHQSQVTQSMSRSIKLLKETNPGIRLIVSFADPMQNHHGGIYQAGNWIYAGKTPPSKMWKAPDGSIIHDRDTRKTGFGTKGKNLPVGSQAFYAEPKFRYLYPLDKAMRRQIQSLAQPYPRGSSLKGETADVQSARPGSIPGNRSNS